MGGAKLYFDPGGVCAGWALFVNGRLVACGLSRSKAKTPFLRGIEHRTNLTYVWDTTPAVRGSSYRCRSEAMWYRPITYSDKKTGKKRKKTVPPQDIIDLNLIAGHVGTEWVYPHDWKGMQSKDVHQPKILACLSTEERALVDAVKPPSLRHNCIDAVGIGLQENGRLKDTWDGELPQQVRSLIKRTLKQPAKSSPTPSKRGKGARGKQRRTPPSFVTLPKGSLTTMGPMARANASRAA